MKKIFLSVVLVTSLSLVSVACNNGGAGSNGGGGAQEVQTIVVGYSNSLSGDFAAYGTPMRNGTQLAVDEVNQRATENGFRLQLEIRDDRTDPKEGTVIAQGFCDDQNIKAVLGFNWSTLLLAAMPIYGDCGLPVVATETSSPELSGINPYFHRVILSDGLTGAKITEYAVDTLGATNLAVFNPNDDYGTGVSQVAIKQAQDLGASIVFREQYAYTTKDFRASVTKLRDANPDAILLLGFFSDSAKIVQQAREVGVTAPFVASQSMRAPDFIKLAGDAAEGTYVASDFEPSASPRAQQFVDDFTAKYGHPPDTSAALGYDSVLALADALERTTDSTRQGVNSALGEASVDGLTGHLSFDQNGEVTRELYWVKVEDGDFVRV